MQFSKERRRKRIHYRIRKKVNGTATCPRIAVYRSNKDIYAQVIDDVAGVTVLAASSKGVDKGQPRVAQSKAVGILLAEKLAAANITKAVFDRGGYLYHGRVKALADGLREGGLNL